MLGVIIFLIVALVAILSAALMLISANAIHSALFLVLNFACVAFFFVTLGAPFIALVQVAVYAGAIMVLFLFVIMLLGAERVAGPDTRQLNWLPRAALLLALIFIIAVGVAIGGGEIDLMTPPPTAPQVRVIHAADAPPLDFRLNNDQAVFEGLEFYSASEYISLPPGEYGITVFPAGADPATESPAIIGNQILCDGDVITLVAIGSIEAGYRIGPIAQDLSPVEGDRMLRLTLFNAIPDSGPLDVIELRSSLAGGMRLVVNGAVYGAAAEANTVEAAEDIELQVVDSLQFAEVETEDGETEMLVVGGGEEVITYRELDLESGSITTLLVAPGDDRVVPMMFADPVNPYFGSPQQVAQRLFTTYVLPFEMVGILLLAALVGAISLTRDEITRERIRRKVVRRPLVGPDAVTTAADLAASESPEAAAGD